MELLIQYQEVKGEEKKRKLLLLFFKSQNVDINNPLLMEEINTIVEDPDINLYIALGKKKDDIKPEIIGIFYLEFAQIIFDHPYGFLNGILSNQYLDNKIHHYLLMHCIKYLHHQLKSVIDEDQPFILYVKQGLLTVVTGGGEGEEESNKNIYHNLARFFNKESFEKTCLDGGMEKTLDCFMCDGSRPKSCLFPEEHTNFRLIINKCSNDKNCESCN